jgi:transporter family protein
MVADTLAPPQACPNVDPNSRRHPGVVTTVVRLERTVPVSDARLNEALIFGLRAGESAQNLDMLSALRQTVRAKWFWYAGASLLCWTGWAFTAKIGSGEIPPASMQFISAFGFVLVSLFALPAVTAKGQSNRRGKLYALVSGVLLAFGGICLYGAYRSGSNASTITAITSLYPIITVLCGTTFLREKLNRLQLVGLLFAAAAIFMLSI